MLIKLNNQHFVKFFWKLNKLFPQRLKCPHNRETNFKIDNSVKSAPPKAKISCFLFKSGIVIVKL